MEYITNLNHFRLKGMELQKYERKNKNRTLTVYCYTDKPKNIYFLLTHKVSIPSPFLRMGTKN